MMASVIIYLMTIIRRKFLFAGFSEPRKLGRNGQPLASARAVANAVHESPEIEHVKYTHMLMQFAQFVDHDMTHAPVARCNKKILLQNLLANCQMDYFSLAPDGKLLNCTRCDSPETISPSCFPITIPANDPFFPPKQSDGSPRCLAFVRSLIGQLTLGKKANLVLMHYEKYDRTFWMIFKGYREQINQLSSFLDTSTVYGSYDCQANELRLYSQGKLNYTERLDNLQHGLPQGFKEPDCRSLPKYNCFVAGKRRIQAPFPLRRLINLSLSGDNRVNEQTGLAVLHTMYLREHNRIAERLHRINNFWTDEKIYQVNSRLWHIYHMDAIWKDLL